MISALAPGQSSITGLSSGEDVASTSVIIEQLGASRHNGDGIVFITGPEHGLRASVEPLDCGNSGTTMRLLSGVVSGIAGTHQLLGDESLSRRPMDRVATPLELMGVRIHGNGATLTPPLRIESALPLHGISYRVPVVSAQVKSAILFAGLAALDTTTVNEDIRTRSTTEDMLRDAGVEVMVQDVGRGRQVTLSPSRPRRHDWHVPGDPSQAAFFAVLGAIHDDASLEVLNVDASPERIGYVGVLQRMGGDVRLIDHGSFHALHAKSSTLLATEIHAVEIPSVDEVPILTVAACAAKGVSAFRSMSELRLKESDRFDASMSLARKLGCRVWAEGDDFFVEGLAGAARFDEFTMSSSLDHRMVMAAAVAGCAGKGCTIEGAATVSTSYPHFFRDLALLQ